jgi:hypothetical protein
LLGLAIVGSIQEVAFAQSPTAHAAEGLFQEGIALLESGKTSEACAKFVESYGLEPANGTLQNVASCHEKEGKTATSWSEWSELAGKAARAGQKDREALARTRAAALSRELAKLHLQFPEASNVATIELDGQPLVTSAWHTPLPLDPGPHALVFKASGRKEATENVTIEPRVSATVDVPVLEPEVVAAESPPPAVKVEAALPVGDGRRTLGYAVGAVGVVGLAAGGFFGLRAMSQKDNAACDGAICASQDAVDQRDSAKTSATLSTIGFGVGIVALGVATYLVLSSNKPTTGRAHASAVERVLLARW